MRERGREREIQREIQHERERGGKGKRYNERGERDSARGRGTVGQTDRQIDVQMTYVMQYFHFENSFE